MEVGLIAFQIAVSDINKFAFVVEGAESISRLIGRYAIFEEIYLLQASDVRTELESALTRFYASILLYLSKARSFFEQSTASMFIVGSVSEKGLNEMQHAYSKGWQSLKMHSRNCPKASPLSNLMWRNSLL